MPYERGEPVQNIRLILKLFLFPFISLRMSRVQNDYYLYSLTLYQGLRMGQNPEYHMLYCALFFENHPS